MKFSTFGDKFARECGILQLMDDLGHALAEGGDDIIMLGGGNPSRVPAVEACLRERMETMLRQGDAFERLVGNYAEIFDRTVGAGSPVGLARGVNALWSLSPVIGGAVMGALWQVFVIFGVHWGFVPVMIQDLTTQGYSLLTGPLFAAVLAQGAAATAVMIKTRNKELKEIAGPAALSAIGSGVAWQSPGRNESLRRGL